jgi:hypothetical protein
MTIQRKKLFIKLRQVAGKVEVGVIRANRPAADALADVPPSSIGHKTMMESGH